MLNNYGDGMVKQWQKLFFKGRLSASDKSLHKKDFVKAAQADGFGYAVRLDRKADVPRVIAEFIEFKGPAFLEVIIDPDAGVYPMVGPGMAYDEMITGDHIPSRYARRKPGTPDGRRCSERVPLGAERVPTFAEAARFWLQLGFVSFGRSRRADRDHASPRWSKAAAGSPEKPFTDALNFCMLLPGPEALQLAIYLGWKLHGVRGGLAPPGSVVLPAIVLLMVLAYLYAQHGSQPIVSGLLVGLKAAVIALVVQAIVRIGRRALRRPVHWVLAAAASRQRSRSCTCRSR